MDTFVPSSGAFFSITQITCVAVHAQVGQTGNVTQTVELETMRIREAYRTHVWVRVTWGGGGRLMFYSAASVSVETSVKQLF